MPTYQLASPTPPRLAPELDDAQRRVVGHGAGPLLVLAGPGTGKTTTMVEAIVDRIESRGARPDQVLALTFSRKAAEQLRDRVTGRLGRTMGTPISSTFHSFAYSLVREYADKEAYPAPLRLLSAPEQDVVLQTLLQPTPESVRWPESLAQALPTRGFSREVQMLLARAREKGLGPADLVRVGTDTGRDEWVAAGRFLEQYLTNLDDQAAIDYPDLIVRAVALAEQPDIRAKLRARYDHVFVDEYQDTDPSQVALLSAIAGDGRNLVVVGDPDQSIYGFRGADVRGILDFPKAFPSRTGQPASVVALQTTRRFGPNLLAASRNIATSLPAGGAIPAEVFQRFRDPTPVEGDHGPGEIEVLLFDTARAETEHIADRLRRAHLEDGIDWSQMAVLVRSGRGSIPALRRSLTAAGVPVEVAADETPLVREPAVLPLLDALRVVLNLGNEDRQHPDYVDPGRAEALLMSPLGGLDAAEVRTLARALRKRERVRATAEDRAPRSSPELVRAALLDPAELGDLDRRSARKARRLGELLRATQAQVADREPAETVLWTLWSGTGWPQRLRRSATAGGAGALLAHRDLDAVCALFDAAAKAEEQRGHTSVQSLLDTLTAQQIPADTLADRGVRGDAVRLLTAHRSKGLEWEYVVVAQVQEGTWPDLRRRSSLLRADELATDGSLPPLTARALLAEERRLFYVACTRARRRLLVTSVQSPDEDGDQPSRFVTELGIEARQVQGRPRRPLSLPGLVAELRRTACDPASSEPIRAAAVRRLARLALVEDEAHPGQSLVPQADPANWWGTRARSVSMQPLRAPEEPIMLSASALQSLLDCPAKWFLEREAGGSTMSTSAQGFGLVVHTLADRIVKGDVTESADLMAYVDRIWGELVFRTPWSAARERAEIEAALQRFLAWHHRPGARVVLGTETRLRAEIQVGAERIVLRGFADRLEVDENGHVVVIDLKTTKGLPTQADVDTHAQLALYQHAINHGAADHLLDGATGRAGGAELIQLRHDAGGLPKVLTQPPGAQGDGPALVETQIAEAVSRIRSERFPAKAGDHCKYCDFVAICPIKGAGTVLS